MRPVFRTGDAVLVDPTLRDDLAPGHVITFLNEDTLMTHRVIRVGNAHVVTKGDHVRNFDPAVPRSRVLGVVVARERAGQQHVCGLTTADRWVAALSGLEGQLQQALVRAKLDRWRIVRAAVHLLFRILIWLASRPIHR